MKKNSDGQQRQQGGLVSRSARSSFRAISSYLRIVSSGASTVARSAVSVASSIVEKEDDASHDQVLWAGFDKLEGEGDISRRVLLLGYRSGFQVWDVEEADNVRDLVSRHDGSVSFMQMLQKPIASISGDKFADSRPLMVVCVDSSLSGGAIHDGLANHNGSTPSNHDLGNASFGPTVVRFYSLTSQSYAHMLKFRSAIYSVRCSHRVVAISQAAQIHCFNASTLEREYTILTNPIVTGSTGSGGIGFGPLAVGPRWLAYSGCPVVPSNSGRVSPQHLAPASFPGFASNGSLVAHYAKESSKQLAVGIVTLGDMGYKKLSRYCSELLPDSYNSLQPGSPVLKGNRTVNGHLPDADNIGMVIVRDIVSKTVVAQFRAHKSPISALCFDPSGTLLVTASVQGHSINVYRIMPGLPHPDGSSACESGAPYVHLYRLQRGFTNAVIEDISFSDDSNWIMISSSRGTSHVFAINPFGGSVILQSADTGITTSDIGLGATSKPAVRWPPNLSSQLYDQQSICAPGPPVTLSVVSRIRNGSNGWKGTVSGAAAAATGRMSSLSAIASSFHSCKVRSDLYGSPTKAKYHLLVFSPSGCMIQYALRIPAVSDPTLLGIGNAYESVPEGDGRLVIEPVQKWNICQKQTRREREDNVDIYGENGGNLDSNKIYPEEIKSEDCSYSESRETIMKAKINPEEKQHLYISEAELHMHQPRRPLWAKGEVSFQSMVLEEINMEEENLLGGEIEIERISCRMIEARSKHLVPVSDNLQAPKYQFQQARVSAVDNYTNGGLLHQRSGLSENGHLSSMDGGVSVAELHNTIDSPRMPVDSKGFVDKNDSHITKTRLETVNNIKSLSSEAQPKFVNNINGALKVDDPFLGDGDEFD